MLNRAVVALALIGACSVHRRSEDLRCTDSSQCMGGATCEQNYCVEDPSCPSPCNCDPTTSPPTCTITAGIGGGSFTCPDGMHCNITCPDSNACGNIHCDGDCTIICTGDDACGSITCSGGRCNITCTGNLACGSVSCSQACACDVTCTGTCGSFFCPRVMGNNCTTTGSSGAACSSATPACDRC